MNIRLKALIKKMIWNKFGAILNRISGKHRTWSVAYVILMSDEIHNIITKWQINILDKYGTNSGLTAMPHLTLKLGFEVTCLDQYEKYFDNLVKDIEPFEICVNGINKFEDGIIFVDVEKNPRLDQLRRRILNDLHQQFGVKPYRLEGDQFRFHVTLAYGLPISNFIKAYEELKIRPIQASFMLSKMSLFCHSGENWVSYKQATITNHSNNKLLINKRAEMT